MLSASKQAHQAYWFCQCFQFTMFPSSTSVHFYLPRLSYVSIDSLCICYCICRSSKICVRFCLIFANLINFVAKQAAGTGNRYFFASHYAYGLVGVFKLVIKRMHSHKSYYHLRINKSHCAIHPGTL